MLNIIIHGCNGKMGKVIENLVNEDNTSITVAGVDAYYANSENKLPYPVFKSIADCNILCDVIIDFSTAKAIPGLMKYAVEKKKPVVFCTTGLDEETKQLVLASAKEIAIFKSANMSLGINLLRNFLKKTAPVLNSAGFDIEIIERHHNQKIDAPSGTALLLADAIKDSLEEEPDYIYDRSKKREKRTKNEIGIHSVRGGTIVGEHSVLFAGNNELLEFTHTATSKDVFGVGALNAAKFIHNKPPGLYDMQDMLDDLLN